MRHLIHCPAKEGARLTGLVVRANPCSKSGGGLEDGTGRRGLRGSNGRRRRPFAPSAARRLGGGVPPTPPLRPAGGVRQRGAEPCARRGPGGRARLVDGTRGGA